MEDGKGGYAANMLEAVPQHHAGAQPPARLGHSARAQPPARVKSCADSNEHK